MITNENNTAIALEFRPFEGILSFNCLRLDAPSVPRTIKC